jgi:glucosamine--fructose-6-phosphate aminotransferase (isomerizing)
LASLALGLGRERGVLSKDDERALVQALVEVPRHISTILRNEQQFEAIAQSLSKARDVLYLGRGTSYPLALEGALKLKEISYIHAEGYAAGELKHGPIALIDENVPVIVVAPQDDLFEKTVSNMQEVATRGGQIILISDAPPEKVGCKVAAHIEMPTACEFTNPLIYAVPVQLLAYHTAVIMGTDVDQPRNLAKSVTVE